MSDRDKIIRYEWISGGLLLLGFGVIFLVDKLNLHLFWNVIGFAFIIAGAICNYMNLKCPHCGSSLWGVRFIPDHCPHCGKKIE